MNENEFIFDGKIYVAIPEPDDCCCECDLLMDCSPDGIKGVPECQANKRTDGRDVIFVEKQPMTNRDYVNTKKPSALKLFWNRHGDSVRFWVIVGLIILTSSVYAG